MYQVLTVHRYVIRCLKPAMVSTGYGQSVSPGIRRDQQGIEINIQVAGRTGVFIHVYVGHTGKGITVRRLCPGDRRDIITQESNVIVGTEFNKGIVCICKVCAEGIGIY